MTVALRPLTRGDAPWLDLWLPISADSAGYDRPPGARAILERSRTERGLKARVIARGEDPIGLALYHTRTPGREAARFEIVVLEPSAARCGYGLRAAALVEDEMLAAGARTAFAPAPAAHGIDVYFWIRLGYRPLLRGEWPCERPGVAWLARDLGA